MKEESKSGLKFKIGITLAILIFIAVSYFTIKSDRLTVNEGNGFIQDPVLPSNSLITYKTEFCASRLTDLAHELHFLKREVDKQETIIGEDTDILEQEQSVIEIEQREIAEVQDEFDKYTELCTQFDQQPTKELCNLFTNEAQESLDLAQENALDTESKGLAEWIKITLHDLRKAKRIYNDLQTICESINS